MSTSSPSTRLGNARALLVRYTRPEAAAAIVDDPQLLQPATILACYRSAVRQAHPDTAPNETGLAAPLPGPSLHQLKEARDILLAHARAMEEVPALPDPPTRSAPALPTRPATLTGPCPSCGDTGWMPHRLGQFGRRPCIRGCDPA